jgi:hypothetical protein
VSSEIAASESHRSALEHAEPAAARRASGVQGLFARIDAGVARLWTSMPVALRLAAAAALGA